MVVQGLEAGMLLVMVKVLSVSPADYLYLVCLLLRLKR